MYRACGLRRRGSLTFEGSENVAASHAEASRVEVCAEAGYGSLRSSLATIDSDILRLAMRRLSGGAELARVRSGSTRGRTFGRLASGLHGGERRPWACSHARGTDRNYTRGTGPRQGRTADRTSPQRRRKAIDHASPERGRAAGTGPCRGAQPRAKPNLERHRARWARIPSETDTRDPLIRRGQQAARAIPFLEISLADPIVRPCRIVGAYIDRYGPRAHSGGRHAAVHRHGTDPSAS